MRDLPISFLVEVGLLFVEVGSLVDVSDMIVCVVSLLALDEDEDVCSVFSDVVVDNAFVVLSDVESTLNVLVVVSAETVILFNDVEFSLEPSSTKRLSTESV